MGRASRFQQEVNVERCLRDNVPILRRASGGSTNVAALVVLIHRPDLLHPTPPLEIPGCCPLRVMNRIEQSVRLAFDFAN